MLLLRQILITNTQNVVVSRTHSPANRCVELYMDPVFTGNLRASAYAAGSPWLDPALAPPPYASVVTTGAAWAAAITPASIGISLVAYCNGGNPFTAVIEEVQLDYTV